MPLYHSKFPYFGQTALHIAVQKKRKGFIELLLKSGADPNALSSPLLQVDQPVSAVDIANRGYNPKIQSILFDFEMKHVTDTNAVDLLEVKESKGLVQEDNLGVEALLATLNDHWKDVNTMQPVLEIPQSEENKSSDLPTAQGREEEEQQPPVRRVSEYLVLAHDNDDYQEAALPVIAEVKSRRASVSASECTQESHVVADYLETSISPQPNPQASPQGSLSPSLSASPAGSPQGSRRNSESLSTEEMRYHHAPDSGDELESDQIHVSNPDSPEPYDAAEQVSFKCLQLGKLLGQGHYGSVIQARLKTMGSTEHRDVGVRDIAVKIFNLEQATRELKSAEEARYSFMYEIQLLQKCRHPCVVEFYGISKPPDNPQHTYMLMELCTGGTLKTALHNTRNPIAWKTKYLAMVDMCSAGFARAWDSASRSEDGEYPAWRVGSGKGGGSRVCFVRLLSHRAELRRGGHELQGKLY